MTAQGALGGLLDRARGALAGVRPALEPRFAPRYVEPTDSDDGDPPTPAQAGVELSTPSREHASTLPPSLGVNRAADSMAMPDHARSDDLPLAGSRDVRSVHASAAAGMRLQTNVSIPLRGVAVATPERNVAPHEAMSLRTLPIEPTFVESQPAPASEPSAAPGRATARWLPEASLEQDVRDVTRAPSSQIAPLTATSPAYEIQPTTPRAPGLPPPRVVQSADTPAPPRVQVSIGRVEVRGAPVRTAPAAAPPSANATLSLHAYLQRSRGGHS